MVKEKAFAQSLLQQTNDVLDAIEGKKEVIEVTSFVGVQYIDIKKIRERITNLRGGNGSDKDKQPNVNKTKGAKQK